MADSVYENSGANDLCGAGTSVSFVNDGQKNLSRTIEELRDEQFVKSQLELAKASAPLASEWRLNKHENGTDVTWQLESEEVPFLKRPKVLLDKIRLSSDCESGLVSLKQLAEAQIPTLHRFDVYRYTVEAFPAIVKDTVVEASKVDSFLEVFFQEADRQIRAAGAEPQELHIAAFKNWNDRTVSISAITPMPGYDGTSDISNVREYTPGKIIKADHFGSLDNIEDTHYFLQSYAEENKIHTTGRVYEIYTFGSHNVSDPNDWVTAVAYSVD